MNKEKKQVARMAVRTWSWLKVNESEIPLVFPEEKKKSQISISGSDAILIDETIKEGIEDSTKEFESQAITEYFGQQATVCHHIIIPENHNEEEPIRIVFSLEESSPLLVEDIVIEAKKNSSASIIIEYRADEMKGWEFGSHIGRTRAIVGEKATLNLIRTQQLPDFIEHSDWFGATVDTEGKLSLLQAEMGSYGAKASWNVILKGNNSDVRLDILYLGEKSKKLDFSSRVEFLGKESTSLVRARGILLGESKKIFRDSLDFISGARGAKGREEEDVLMLSSKARNISVPLLFCGEDDVQGEHAASSGRPNEGLLFYLMSRGMSEPDAKKLLAESRFGALLEQLSDETLKEEILAYLRQAIEGEEAYGK
ncbi:MAG: Fe-S cluster assembly protein SufD [Clostridiales bacterium]|nr:Fe-S cluster assembly protein SufD [Clostridiales bacterium]